VKGTGGVDVSSALHGKPERSSLRAGRPPDVTVKPKAVTAFTLTLPDPVPKGPLSLSVRAFLLFVTEGGWSESMELTVNEKPVTDAFLPTNLPKTFRTPNYGRGPWPWYSPDAKAWTLFYDNNPAPPASTSRYFSPDVTEYRFAFPVHGLLKGGANVIRVRNRNERHSIRILSEAGYREAMESIIVAKPVPADRLVPGKWAFPKPAASAAREGFLVLHRLLESIRNEDGSWGRGYSDWPSLPAKKEVTHPLIRFVGYPVLAYLIADGLESTPRFRQRAFQGLEYLLKDQDPSGGFRWYWVQEGVLDANALYPTGIAGRALVAGYEAFQDPRFLEASAKAAAWEMAMPVSPNANYNMFAVWHLAAHFRVSKERRTLDAAVGKTLQVLKGQTELGCWSDAHNQTVYYMGIILRGLVELLSVMPKDHAQIEAVRQGVIRAANHLIGQQRKDGALQKHPTGGGRNAGALVLPALIKVEGVLGGDLGTVIAGLIRCPKELDSANPASWKHDIDGPVLAAATAWAWAKKQEKGKD
jgi:hypothetical protein